MGTRGSTFAQNSSETSQDFICGILGHYLALVFPTIQYLFTDKLLDHRTFYVKIAALNKIFGMPSEMVGASIDEIRAFSQQLDRYQLPHKVFVGDGLDVHASCGQLAAVPQELHA